MESCTGRRRGAPPVGRVGRGEANAVDGVGEAIAEQPGEEGRSPVHADQQRLLVGERDGQGHEGVRGDCDYGERRCGQSDGAPG